VSKLHAPSRWRLLAGLGLSALCLFLAVRKVSLANVGSLLAGAGWGSVLLAMATTVVLTTIKAARWRALFLPRQVPMAKAWSAFMIGQMLNALLPARAGEVGRIYLIGAEEEGASRTTALFTIVVEKVVDLVMLALAYLSVALWLAATPIGVPKWLREAGISLIPLTILALGTLFLLARVGNPAWQRLRAVLKPLPEQWLAAADTIARRTIAALNQSAAGGARSQVWCFSLLAWLLMALVNRLILHAYDLALSPGVALLLLVVLMTGVAVPPLPGTLGVFPYLCQLVLLLFGVDRETGLAYGLTLQVVTYLPLITLGLACLIGHNLSVGNGRHKPGPPAGKQQGDQGALIDGPMENV